MDFLGHVVYGIRPFLWWTNVSKLFGTNQLRWVTKSLEARCARQLFCFLTWLVEIPHCLKISLSGIPLVAPHSRLPCNEQNCEKAKYCGGEKIPTLVYFRISSVQDPKNGFRAFTGSRFTNFHKGTSSVSEIDNDEDIPGLRDGGSSCKTATLKRNAITAHCWLPGLLLSHSWTDYCRAKAVNRTLEGGSLLF